MTKEELRLQLLQLAVQHAGPKNAVRVAAEYEAFVKDGTLRESHNNEATNQQPQTAVSVVERQPEPPQPAAPTGAATATTEECVEAFKRHIAKSGNTVKTGREAVVKAVPHFITFPTLTPEDRALAIAAMDAA